MRLDEAFKKIKSYDARGDISVRSFLIVRFHSNNKINVCISVKDNLISLSDLPLSVDDMLADDWDLLTHYKMGNSYEELED